MTISKKLFLMTSLALGMQFNANAFCDDSIFKNERSAILTFAQELRSNNSTHAQKVAQWLEQQALNESGYYHGTIIDIITNHNLTEQSKITLLSELIARQKNEAQKYATRRYMENICAGLFCVATFALFTAAIIDDIKNPKPRIYCVKPRRRPRDPFVRVRFTAPSFPHCPREYNYGEYNNYEYNPYRHCY